jgi:hypothetical protein
VAFGRGVHIHPCVWERWVAFHAGMNIDGQDLNILIACIPQTEFYSKFGHACSLVPEIIDSFIPRHTSVSKIHRPPSKKSIIVGEITQFPSAKVATVAVATFLMPEIIFFGKEIVATVLVGTFLMPEIIFSSEGIVATVMVATFLMSQMIATVTVAGFFVSKLPATAAVATLFSTQIVATVAVATFFVRELIFTLQF